MDIVDNVDTTKALSVGGQFAKYILGMAAGFLAGKAVEEVFDKVVASRENKTVTD